MATLMKSQYDNQDNSHLVYHLALSYKVIRFPFYLYIETTPFAYLCKMLTKGCPPYKPNYGCSSQSHRLVINFKILHHIFYKLELEPRRLNLTALFKTIENYMQTCNDDVKTFIVNNIFS
jgi:hypothetical protein